MLISGALLTQHATVFATNIVIGRELGAGALGELSLLRSLAAIVLIVTPLGLDLALLKYASLYQDRPAELRSLTRLLRLLVAGVNAALLIMVALWLGPLLGGLYSDIGDFGRLAVLTMVGVVFAADLQVTGALFRAENRTGTYFIYANYIQYTLRMVLSVAVIALGGGVLEIIAVNTAVAAATVVLVELDRRRRLAGTTVPLARMVPASTDILRESVWMCGALLLYSCMRLMDVVVLGALKTPEITGQYAAMSMVAQVIAIYPSAISQTLGPRIALLHEAGDRGGMHKEIGGYLRKAALLGGFLLGGIAAFGTDLDLVFGADFAFTRPLVLLLALGWYISAVLAPMGYVLSMTGRHRQEIGVLAAGSMLMMISLLAFIPWLGGTGAALAVAITFISVNVIRANRVIRVLGRNPLRFRHVVPPLLFVAAAAGVSMAGQSLAERSFFLLVAQCVAYAVLAAVLYLVVFAQADERRAILRRVPRGVPGE
jgi:O-antigen/teichoic acid export membrane protein